MTSQKLALSCPTCLAALAARADGLHCGECGADYPVSDGIADLRKGRKDYYFNPVPRPAMRELIGEAGQGNWAGAIRQFVELQAGNEVYVFVASYHALTSVRVNGSITMTDGRARAGRAGI